MRISVEDIDDKGAMLGKIRLPNEARCDYTYQFAGHHSTFDLSGDGAEDVAKALGTLGLKSLKARFKDMAFVGDATRHQMREHAARDD